MGGIIEERRESGTTVSAYPLRGRRASTRIENYGGKVA
jgi:hypothetical protein